MLIQEVSSRLNHKTIPITIRVSLRRRNLIKVKGIQISKNLDLSLRRSKRDAIFFLYWKTKHHNLIADLLNRF